jgi:biopolymer transport protein ExbB
MIKRLFLLLFVLFSLTAIAGTASAQPDEAQRTLESAPESFANAFFISRVTNPDGSKSLDIFGSILLWILLLLSIASIGMIGMMTLTNQRKAYVPAGVIAKIKRMMSSDQFREAIELTSVDKSFFSAVINAALREANHGLSAVIRALDEASEELTTQRLRRVEYLNILAQVSPMIGLFGTVWGMILAFRAIVMAGGNADPVMLAGGIGTALTTTFWGLLIAIPALATYAIIRNRIDEYSTEATRMAEEILNELRPKTTRPSKTEAVEARAKP